MGIIFNDKALLFGTRYLDHLHTSEKETQSFTNLLRKALALYQDNFMQRFCVHVHLIILFERELGR